MKPSGILIFAITISLSSCLSSKFIISPPFTSTEEITSLKPGMTITEVNNSLGINPYEMLSTVEDDMWVSYNYRVKNLINPITSFSNGLDNNDIIKTKESKRVRGYLSAVDNDIHFGLGTVKNIDSLIIRWNSGKIEKLANSHYMLFDSYEIHIQGFVDFIF